MKNNLEISQAQLETIEKLSLEELYDEAPAAGLAWFSSEVATQKTGYYWKKSDNPYYCFLRHCRSNNL